MRRGLLQGILQDPAKRRELFVQTLIATQAREGITTTQAQAEAAYDKIRKELAMRKTGNFRYDTWRRLHPDEPSYVWPSWNAKKIQECAEELALRPEYKEYAELFGTTGLMRTIVVGADKAAYDEWLKEKYPE